MVWLYVALIALPATFLVLAFVIGLMEKHPVVMFRDVEAIAPDAYTAAMIESAVGEHGFRWRAAGVHTKFPTTRGTLLLSPDSTTLGVVGAGTIVKMPVKRTILISRFTDGSALLSVDEAGAAELDPGTQRQLLMNASFSELWRLHGAAVADRVGDVVLFPTAATWADVDAIYAARAARIVEAGNARFVDADRTRYQYTIIGSFKASIVHGVRQIFTPRNQVRQFIPRPSSRTASLETSIEPASFAESEASPPPLRRKETL